MEGSLCTFLLSAAAISLSGVMLPGPLTAATIAKGYKDRNAGALIAAGHAIIEIPLIIGIYFGLTELVASPSAVRIVYFSGGLVLMFLGFRMLRSSNMESDSPPGLPASALTTGIVITGTNPAFYLWWATVGTVLVTSAARFGVVGLLLFTLVHLPCDLAWSEFLSLGTFGSRRWWTKKVRRAVFSICAFILVGFGLYFCLSPLLSRG